MYHLQESETLSDDLDEVESSRWDSSDSSSTRRNSTTRRQHARAHRAPKKAMSILTNQYFDVPEQELGFGHYGYGAAPGKTARRRFFQGAARWDENAGLVGAGEGDDLDLVGSGSKVPGVGAVEGYDGSA